MGRGGGRPGAGDEIRQLLRRLGGGCSRELPSGQGRWLPADARLIRGRPGARARASFAPSNHWQARWNARRRHPVLLHDQVVSSRRCPRGGGHLSGSPLSLSRRSRSAGRCPFSWPGSDEPLRACRAEGDAPVVPARARQWSSTGAAPSMLARRTRTFVNVLDLRSPARSHLTTPPRPWWAF